MPTPPAPARATRRGGAAAAGAAAAAAAGATSRQRPGRRGTPGARPPSCRATFAELEEVGVPALPLGVGDQPADDVVLAGAGRLVEVVERVVPLAAALERAEVA